MKPSLTDTLCTQCGLCCDGSLFADVELSGRAEATKVEIMGLEVEDDDAGPGLLLLPCRALEGRRCTIYAHRPKCCRTFECRLLQDVRRGAVTEERAQERIADALARTARVNALLRQLGQPASRLPLRERCAEALTTEPSGSPQTNTKRAELEAAMSELDGLLEKTFLSDARK